MNNKSFTLTEKVANLILQVENLPCFNSIERQIYLEIIAELESRICELENKVDYK